MENETDNNGTTAAQVKTSKLTELDLKLLAYAMVYNKSTLDCDYDAIATIMGYRSGQVAKDRIRQVKRKIVTSTGINTKTIAAAQSSGTVDIPSSPTKPAAKPRAPRAKKEHNPDGVKKPRAPRKNSKAAKAAAEAALAQKEDEGDNDVKAEDEDTEMNEEPMV